MGFALIAATSAGAASGGSVTSPAIDTTGADYIIVHRVDWGGIFSISDSYGNAPTSGFGELTQSFMTEAFYVYKNPTVGAGHTFTLNNSRCSIVVLAFSGVIDIDYTSPGVRNKNTGAVVPGTSFSTGSVTPTATHSLVIAGLGAGTSGGAGPSSGTIAVSGGSLAIEETVDFDSANHMANSVAFEVQSTPTARTANWSWTTSSLGISTIGVLLIDPPSAPELIVSTVFGINTDVTAPRAFAVGLDGNNNVLSESGKMKVYGKFEVTGTAEFNSTITVIDDSFSNAKLANMTQATIKGRASGAGTGDPTDLTADQVSTILDTATDPFLRTSDTPAAVDSFKTIAVATQSDVVADSPTDTLTLVAGTNVTITTNAGTDTITIASSGGGGGSITSGTYASLPAAGTAGSLYLPTDSYYDHLLDDGANWVAFRNGQVLTIPTTSGWSWVNQGSATIDTTYGATFLYVPAQGSLNSRIRVRTAPSTPYVVTAAFIIQHSRQNSSAIGAGLCWRESGTGELITWGPVPGNTLANWEYALIKMNSPTSYNSEYASGGEGRLRQPMKTIAWLRFEDNGTNRRTWVSDDGRYWREYFDPTSRTDFLTADEIGFYCDTTDPNLDTGVAVIHWLET